MSSCAKPFLERDLLNKICIFLHSLYVGIARMYRSQDLDTSCPARAFPGPKLFLRHANALDDLHLEVRTNEREEKRRKEDEAGERSRGGGEKAREGKSPRRRSIASCFAMLDTRGNVEGRTNPVRLDRVANDDANDGDKNLKCLG